MNSMDLLLDMESYLLKSKARDPSAHPFLLIPHQNSTGTAQQSRVDSVGCLSDSHTFSALPEDEGGDLSCLTEQAS